MYSSDAAYPAGLSGEDLGIHKSLHVLEIAWKSQGEKKMQDCAFPSYENASSCSDQQVIDQAIAKSALLSKLAKFLTYAARRRKRRKRSSSGQFKETSLIPILRKRLASNN